MPSAFFTMPIIIALMTLVALYFRGKAYLKYFQQEEYDGRRFLSWVRCNAAIDRVATLIIVVSLMAGLSAEPLGAGQFAILIALMLSIFLSRNALTQSKKALVMTSRVKRIFLVYMLVSLAIYTAATIFLHGYHDSMNFNLVILALPALMLQLAPLTLVMAKLLLNPQEKAVQAKFRKEAEDKLLNLKPRIVAITGSFGKTSSKHILNHILSAAQPTLATPGSVNTIMGITRVIRELLKPEHKFFIVEMGAYGPGSIAKLCAFTPPDIGLITAVGAAHYERFKSLQVVAEAKFELAEDVFSRGGRMVVNADGIEPALLDDRLKVVSGDYILVGKDRSMQISKLTMDKEGMTLTIATEGEEDQSLQVPLYGRHQADNILTSIAAARALDVPWSVIRAAMRTMPQIKHRVEVSRGAGQITTINDAYNSNPIGFIAALEVLDSLKNEGGRRILVTPGMVELGTRHDEDHALIGHKAAHLADIVLAVTPDRMPTFVEAVIHEDTAELMQFATQDQAETWVKANVTALDVVLFENNLPDLYESRVFF